MGRGRDMQEEYRAVAAMLQSSYDKGYRDGHQDAGEVDNEWIPLLENYVRARQLLLLHLALKDNSGPMRDGFEERLQEVREEEVAAWNDVAEFKLASDERTRETSCETVSP